MSHPPTRRVMLVGGCRRRLPAVPVPGMHIEVPDKAYMALLAVTLSLSWLDMALFWESGNYESKRSNLKVPEKGLNCPHREGFPLDELLRVVI